MLKNYFGAMMTSYKYFHFVFGICWIIALSSCEDNEPKSGWIQKASPENNYGGTSLATYSFTSDNKAYIASLNVTANKLDWFKYTPSTNLWTIEEAFPLTEYRSYTMSTSDNRKKAYVGLGFSFEELPDGQSNLVIHKDVWEFDAALKQWLQLPDFPGMNQLGFNQPPVAFVIDETLYVVSSQYSECWALDLREKKWSKRNAPVLSTEHKDKLGKGFSYVGSGYILFGKSSYPVDELLVYRYSPSEDDWSIVFQDDIAPDLKEEALFVLFDHLYLGGSLWKKYDLRTMSDLGYFTGMPDTAFNYTYHAVTGFSINNTGFVLYSNREFWQYIP